MEGAITTTIHLSWVCVSIRVSSKKVLDVSVSLPLGSLGEVNISNLQPSDLERSSGNDPDVEPLYR